MHLEKNPNELFYQLLMEKKKEILNELVDEESILTQTSSQIQDIGDFAFELSDKTLISNLSHHQRQVLKDIDLALQRIEKDEYGVCMVCNKPIERSRLEIIPFTTLCMAHKED
jgi:DnaK suppressor protein